MSHLDPDQLALLAMGEPVATHEDSSHLSGCSECTHALLELSHAVDVGRSTLDVGDLETPAPVVWERIAAELQLGSLPNSFAADSGVHNDTASDTSVPDASVPDDSSTYTDSESSSRTSPRQRPRRRRGTVWALAAAIAVIVAGGLGGWTLGQRFLLTPVAEAQLEAFPDHPGAEGSAVVERQRDGEQLVHVTLNADEPSDAYREVWLITADASSLISLGLLEGSEGTFPVPAGVDLRDYVLVDISQEPIDGDPTHSGDSIVRGELTFDTV